MDNEIRTIDVNSLSGFFDKAKKNRESIDLQTWQYLEKLSTLPDKIDEYDAEFEKITGIQSKDWGFVVFASVLQAVRLLISDMLKRRQSDKQSAENTPFHNNDEHSDRTQKKYYATIDEIDRNPVPYDTVLKSDLIKRNYPDLKLSGYNHRFKTAGHDVVLGLVFGTANIMTKTITVNSGALSFDTYHVQSQTAYFSVNNKPVIRDVISNKASTELMFLHIVKRIKEEGKDGWNAMLHAFGKELVHLLSDVRTEHSLPIPLVSSISPNTARIMQACGLDTLNLASFGIDMLLTNWINAVIVYLHTASYNKETDGQRDLYNIRTKRIVLLSNEIMLGCSTIMLAARVIMGDVSAGKRFDFGGSAVALNQLWKTPALIEQVKHEYISKKVLQYIK